MKITDRILLKRSAAPQRIDGRWSAEILQRYGVPLFQLSSEHVRAIKAKIGFRLEIDGEIEGVWEDGRDVFVCGNEVNKIFKITIVVLLKEKKKNILHARHQFVEYLIILRVKLAISFNDRNNFQYTRIRWIRHSMSKDLKFQI